MTGSSETAVMAGISLTGVVFSGSLSGSFFSATGSAVFLKDKLYTPQKSDDKTKMKRERKNIFLRVDIKKSKCKNQNEKWQIKI